MWRKSVERSGGRLLRGAPQGRALPENRPEIANVNDKAAALTDDERPAVDLDGISKRHDPAADAAIPERQRNHAAAFHLAPEPLDDETRSKKRLAQESDQQPDVAAVVEPGECQREHSDLLRLHGALEPALQPAHADCIGNSHQRALKIAVFGPAVGARAMVHADEGDVVSLAFHKRDEKAVHVVEIGKGEKDVAAKRLQPAAGIRRAILEHPVAESVGESG